MHLFYQPLLKNGQFQLETEEARHCNQVLRHQKGDRIWVTDGKGTLAEVKIIELTKRTVNFTILRGEFRPKKSFHHHLAIAPTKNLDRMEWMVEKAAEMQVDEITFLLCQNSERRKLRMDRLEKKVISAMKQSKSAYKTTLHDIIAFEKFIEKPTGESEKYIAVVDPENKHIGDELSSNRNICTLIGPEGDFSPSEIDLARKNGYRSVSLGTPTLRTETAGLLVLSQVNFINRF